MGLGKMKTAGFCQEGALVRHRDECGESWRSQLMEGACGVPCAGGFVEGSWANASVWQLTKRPSDERMKEIDLI